MSFAVPVKSRSAVVLLRILSLLTRVANPKPNSVVMYNLYHPLPKGIAPCPVTVRPEVVKILPICPVVKLALKCAFSVPESKNTVNLTLLYSDAFTNIDEVNVCVGLTAPLSNFNEPLSNLEALLSKVSNEVKV